MSARMTAVLNKTREAVELLEKHSTGLDALRDGELAGVIEQRLLAKAPVLTEDYVLLLQVVERLQRSSLGSLVEQAPTPPPRPPATPFMNGEE